MTHGVSLSVNFHFRLVSDFYLSSIFLNYCKDKHNTGHQNEISDVKFAEKILNVM